ncbi:hypothetical protein ES703_103807 [subsurface metagenome]
MSFRPQGDQVGYTEGCRVYNSDALYIPSGSSTYLTFDSEVYDTNFMHSIITNPERITIRTAGIYLITFHCSFTVNADGYRRAYIKRNGFTIGQDRREGSAILTTSLLATTIQQLIRGDYLRIHIYQNSGIELELLKISSWSPYFMAQRIG